MGIKNEMKIFTTRTLPNPSSTSSHPLSTGAIEVANSHGSMTISTSGTGIVSQLAKPPAYIVNNNDIMYPSSGQGYSSSSPPRSKYQLGSNPGSTTAGSPPVYNHGRGSTMLHGPSSQQYSSEPKGSYMRNDSYMRMGPDPSSSSGGDATSGGRGHYYSWSEDSTTTPAPRSMGGGHHHSPPLSHKESEGEDEDGQLRAGTGSEEGGNKGEDNLHQGHRTKRREIEKKSRERRFRALDALRAVVSDVKPTDSLMIHAPKKDYQADICYDAATIIQRLKSDNDQLRGRVQGLEKDNRILRTQLEDGGQQHGGPTRRTSHSMHVDEDRY